MLPKAWVRAALAAASFCMAANASATVTLQGRVFAQDSGAPLAGVSVEQDSGCSSSGCSYSTTQTDADGRFTLTAVSGAVQVYLHPDYQSDYLDVFDSINVDDGTTVAVVYYLEHGGSISGTVRRASDAAPVPLTTVNFSNAQNGYGTQTDQNGYYEVHQIRAGSYIVDAQPAQDVNLQQQYFSGRQLVPPSQGLQLADQATVNAGQRTGSIDFDLVTGATLQMTVTDRVSGAPVSNALLYASFNDTQGSGFFSSLWYLRNLLTDANGVVSLTGLPAFPVVLAVQGGDPVFSPYVYACGEGCQVSSGTPIALSAGGTTTIAFSLQPGSVVAGKVTARQSGQPVAGAQVAVFQSSGDAAYVVASTTTDSAGNYALEHLQQTYGPPLYAKVSDARIDDTVFLNQIYGGFDCAASTCLPTGDEPFVPIVGGGISPNVNFQLDEGGEILGNTAPYSGYTGPLDVYIELFRGDGSFDSAMFTDHAGNFASGGLSPGSYYLVTHPAVSSAMPCMIYLLVSCGTGAPEDVGKPIVVSGTAHVTITVPLYSEEIFASSFE